MDQQKAVKWKNKFLKLLPKAASVVNFQNPVHSPKRDKRCEKVTNLKSHLGKGFSGPITSIIPAEARRKSKNSNFEEPTSPKISCMGQIKHKKKINTNQKHVSLPRDLKPFSSPPQPQPAKKKKKPPPIKKAKSFSGEKVKKPSAFKSIFGGSKPAAGRKSDASADHFKPPLPDRAPSLSQMRRFASGRDAFSSFDWTAQIAPVDTDNGNYYSDEEIGYSDDDEGEHDVIIPFSAPMLIGGQSGISLEPRKEINLWKRRTMAQPKPLKVNTMV